MDFVMANGDVPHEMDSPYVTMETRSKAYVGNANKLVDRMKTSLALLYQQQRLILSGTFPNETDLVKAKTYAQQLNSHLGSLLDSMHQNTMNVAKTFQIYLNLLHVEYEGISNEKVAWNQLHRLELMGAPENIVQSCHQRLKQLKEKFEQMDSQIVGLQGQIQAYLMAIDHLKSIRQNCEQYAAQCEGFANVVRPLLCDTNQLLYLLINRSMIVTKQPPVIVRRSGQCTNGKQQRERENTKIPFILEIRFLAGKMAGLHAHKILIEPILISEQQAKNIVEGTLNPATQEITPAGKWTTKLDSILNVNCEGYLQADITGARIRSVEKEETDDASKIMYHILFLAKYEQTNPNDPLRYVRYWTISLPFSVVINANRQDKYKRALMFWQIAFGIDDKTSLAVHTDDASEKNGKVPWPKFFTALNYWFKQTASDTKIKITKGLEEHEAYIKHKIGLADACVSAQFVTWEMFYKTKFWEWLYLAADYISSKCAIVWESGFMVGFLSRQLAEQKLAESDVPSMILKFSDSRPGKIVASFNDETSGGFKHVMLDEEDTAVYVDKTLIQCIMCSTKLHCVQKILPVGKSLTDLYNLDRPVSKPRNPSNGKRLADGYDLPGVVMVLGEMPKPPKYTNVKFNQLDFSNIQNQDATSQTSPYFPAAPSFPDFDHWLLGQSPASTSGRTSQDIDSILTNSPEFVPQIGEDILMDFDIDLLLQQSPLHTPVVEHGNPWAISSPQMVQNHVENGQVQGVHGLCQNQPLQADQSNQFFYQDQNVYQPAMQQNGHQPFAQQMLQQNGNHQPLAQQMNGQHAPQNGSSPPPNPFTTRCFTMNAEAHQSSHFNGQLFEGM